MRAFLRAHRNQIDLDVFAIGGLRKLLNSPFQPALFFCSVGYADLYVRLAGKDARAACASARAFRGRPAGEQVVSTYQTAYDEKKNYDLSRRLQLGFICWHWHVSALVRRKWKYRGRRRRCSSACPRTIWLASPPRSGEGYPALRRDHRRW